MNDIASPTETYPQKSARILLWSSVLVGLVFLLWAANYYFLHDKLETRGTFGDMFGAVNALFSGLAFAGVVIAIVLQGKELEASRQEFILSAREQRHFYEREHRSNIRESTQVLFDRWWSPEMGALRNYFYSEFLPKHFASSQGLSLKTLHQSIDDPEMRLSRLTGFFDYVGWLGAAGLIDVDYVLGPMQHAVRRVWFATSEMVTKARGAGTEQADPAYRMGFEWLYLRTTIEDRDHAALLERAFRDPQLLSKTQVASVREELSSVETQFLAQLANLRASGRSNEASQETPRK